MRWDSLEIYCFQCEIEILDEVIMRQFGPGSLPKPIVEFKVKVIEKIMDFLKKKSGVGLLDSKVSFENTGLHLLQNASLSNSFSTAMYLLWSIPYIRYVHHIVIL